MSHVNSNGSSNNTSTNLDLLPNKRTLEQQDVIVEQSIAKKQKNYTPEASRVVHLRNLPLECTEYDIHHIAIPFGQVQHIVILKGKGQALIQMINLQAAESFVQYYTTIQGTVGGKNFFIQFSNRDEISPSIETPNNILLVTITNIVYPITIEILFKLFSSYGNVLKILIFNKNGNFQSLVEMINTKAATVSKQALDGQCLYTGCCNIKIQYSSLNCLKIRYNNDKSRDFTNPNLHPTPPLLQTPPPYLIHHPIGILHHPSLITPSPISVAGATLGSGSSIVPPLPTPSPTLATGITSATSTTTINNVSNGPFSNGNVHVGNNVLIIAGLPKDVTPDDLFTLFGVYGDIIRVKILYNKKDTALVQMNSPQQAELVVQYLHTFPFRGNTIRVNISKHNSISLPKSCDNQDGLTKDYTGSSMHRFKLPGSKNYQNIHPPTNILHVSNIPTNIEDIENKLKNAFSHYGEVKSFKFFQNDTKMALVELSSIESSINSLVGLHGYCVGENVIKVSFAKPTIKRTQFPIK